SSGAGRSCPLRSCSPGGATPPEAGSRRRTPNSAAMVATVEFSGSTVDAIVTGVVGVALVLIARWLLRAGFRRYVRRAETRRSADDAAKLRTRLTVVQRVIVAFLFALVAWSVLNTIPATRDLGRALLASSAVLALIAGLAFSVPLSNLGAGLLLGFTQP